MSTFIDIAKWMSTLPLADERGRELLGHWCLTLGTERTERLLNATRAQLRAGSHVATPERAAKMKPPGATMHPELWTSEAEACAYRGAGMYLDFVLPTLRHFEGRLDRGWADPWHWLLEPDEIAPTKLEARYRVVSGQPGRDHLGYPIDAWQALRELERWHGHWRQVRAELDMEASLAQARKRRTHDQHVVCYTS